MNTIILTKGEEQEINKLTYSDEPAWDYAGLHRNRKTPAISLEAVKLDVECYRQVPYESLTWEIMYEAIKQDPLLIHVHPELLDERLCLTAVQRTPEIVLSLPERLQTREVWKEAIKQSFPITDKELIKGKSWTFDKNPYPDLVIEALDRFSDNFNLRRVVRSYLKQEGIDFKIIDFILSKDIRCYRYLKKEYKHHRNSLDAVGANGTFLEYVKRSLKTELMCKTAVANNPYAMTFVPTKYQTKEFYEWAVSQNPMCLKYIPYGEDYTEELEKLGLSKCNPYEKYLLILDLYEEELRLEVIRSLKGQEGISLMGTEFFAVDEYLAEEVVKSIPSDYPLLPKCYMECPQIVKLAIEGSPENIQHIPPEYKTQKLFLKVVKDNPEVVEYLPSELRTQETYNQLIRKNEKVIQHTPSEFVTKEMCGLVADRILSEKDEEKYCLFYYINDTDTCFNALKEARDSEEVFRIFTWVSVDRQTIKMVNYAVEQNSLSLRHVREDLVTEELCKKAVIKNPLSFEDVPLAFCTPELCLVAVKGDASMSKVVPFSIEDGRNIYSFNTVLENQTGKKHSYEDVKAIYEGKEIILPTSEKVRFDKDNFSFSPSKEQKQSVQKNKSKRNKI